MYGLASGAELLAYFDQVMQQRFLPSGRVRCLPMSQVVGAYEVESLVTGARQPVKVRKKVVDGTHSRMQVPATTPPRYAVAPASRCVPVNELARLARPQAGYVVVGAGKTGMDACLWLLEQGVEPVAHPLDHAARRLGAGPRQLPVGRRVLHEHMGLP